MGQDAIPSASLPTPAARLGDAVSDPVEKPESNALLTPYQLGPFSLSHRIVLAPLTRCRSYNYIPQQHEALYFAQRTTKGGLLISQATAISGTAAGTIHVPGIWTEEQTEAWKPIVQAVHEKGGIFFCQLWHAGRVTHSAHLVNGQSPVSSTNKKPSGKVFLRSSQTYEDYSVPRALGTDEIALIVEDYKIAAHNAIKADNILALEDEDRSFISWF
ncbi:hypothetical protein O6H91_05G121500 [Diphasiastrum complanatum]|uniref:Uncharacterized protein n=1 Tax=Diphasiastrum complanatum TaxID=34168 RepID=A0ACC2DT59_DIPCM|nr:hypothetical protein O6H91_05G121500 [Diphasiastrum complanatum]